MSKTPIAELNQMPRDAFVRLVGPGFEHSPWIAEQSWPGRPFSSLEHLHQVMCEIVEKAGLEKQLALIRAHPDLVGRIAREGRLTSESAREQAAAGLDRPTPEEVALFERHNAAYQEKFGFPFIICARLNKKAAILEGFARRLKNSREQELTTALEEIYKIAELRLRDLISDKNMSAKLSTHVLDVAHGCPAGGMKIELWSLEGPAPRLVKTATTNDEGRTETPLLSSGEMKAGLYELVFFVGDYFAAKERALPSIPFLDKVPVRFGIADAGASYHVPLLCSPWSYSVYRGS